VVDAWHLAGLTANPPEDRVQTFELSDGRVMKRKVSPRVDWVEAVTDVRYEIELRQGDWFEEFSESHAMKAFSKTELILLAERVGLTVLFTPRSPALDCDATVEDWHIALIARGAGS